MNNVRIIKKYPNRRLYDTDGSRYITLADVDWACEQATIAEKDFSFTEFMNPKQEEA